MTDFSSISGLHSPSVSHADVTTTAATYHLMVQNLGIAVRQLREKQGWSQEELAEKSGLNRSYVGEVERGKVVASVVTAQKIADALAVSVVDLFTQCDAIARLRAHPAGGFAQSARVRMKA